MGICVEDSLMMVQKGAFKMFMGEYPHSIDEKGRVAIPVKLRRAFGDSAIINRLVVTHGFDKCLMAFREEEWVDFVDNKLMKLSQSERINRVRLRFLVGGAAECELDKQGRILIPAYLKEYAEIDKEVTILGLCDKIEIWNKDLYADFKPTGEALEAFAKDLGF